MQIFLARHSETAWSLTGQHTGLSDIPLTDRGRREAERLGEVLADREYERVLTSPLQRAAESCRIAGFGEIAEVDEDLREWDYGEFEGLTTAAIREKEPGWVLWCDGAPGGESAEQVRERADRLVAGLRKARGEILIFGHGHMLRALAVRWVGLPIEAGRLFRLDTATISILARKREIRVIQLWNQQVR